MKTRWADFIETMAEASSEVWRSTTSRMSWAYRRGEAKAPPPVSEWMELLPTQDEWRALQKEINRRRRNARAAKRYTPLAEKKRKDDRRRDYMRRYMAAYRSRKRVSAEIQGMHS